MILLFLRQPVEDGMLRLFQLTFSNLPPNVQNAVSSLHDLRGEGLFAVRFAGEKILCRRIFCPIAVHIC